MYFIISILVLGGLGFICAIMLGLAAEYFKIQEDSRISTILALLPNANCGVCGCAGCHQFAEKVVLGEIAVSGCLAGGPDVAKKIAEIMGVEGVLVNKKIACVHCGAKAEQRIKTADYQGVKTCVSANAVSNAGMMCKYGCIGFGDCVCVCPFDAITMKDGLPVIDKQKCTACGKCVTFCPRKIISLVPFDAKVKIACSSHDSGAFVRRACKVGCIGCLICEKQVPGYFKISDNLAGIDYENNTVDPSSATDKCPTKCIIKL